MGSLRNISLKSENCHFHISTTIQKCSQKTIKHWSHVYHTNTYLDAPRTCSWYGQATNSLLPTQPNRIFSGLMVISDGVFDVQTKLLLPPVGITKSSVMVIRKKDSAMAETWSRNHEDLGSSSSHGGPLL